LQVLEVLPGRTGYSASKFAVNGFMESLRTELLHSDVNVLWVCPGFTTSNIRNVALNKEGKFARRISYERIGHDECRRMC
jgi:short-subunit dehydrogenase